MNKSPTQDCHNFLEADILVGLHHPAIPILYDLEEDEHSITIIEEYIKGQSLQDYLLYHKTISQITLFQIAIQLCSVVEYLHSYKPYPILYQDMKPNHIIVCGNQIKLIDYGIAIFLTNQGNIFQKYGTKGYAAPEQYTDVPADTRVDIYGVGKVLKELLSHSSLKYYLPMQYLVMRTTASNPKDRPDSIHWLRTRLEEMSRKSVQMEERRSRGQYPFLLPGRHTRVSRKCLLTTIAIVGNGAGNGCTHIAVALTVYLRAMGEKAYYLDQADHRVLQQITRNDPSYVEEDGIIYHELFHGLPQYHVTIKQRRSPEGIRVMDCGCDRTYLTQAEMILYVVSGNIWQMDELPPEAQEMIHYPHVYLICNHSSRGAAQCYARTYNTAVYCYPNDPEPFLINAKKQKIFDKIFQKEMK